ncbi:MAG: YtxH domain-containing protein [Saprospiraceae bacterium]|nr:YtxH domain-containing protein [Candidatus Opimibacter skivensis]
MKTSRVVLGIVAGAAVGAVLGVLFAPDKGSNTRGKMTRKGEDLMGSIKEKANHLVEAVKTPFMQELHDANGKANQAKAKFTELK